MEYSQEQKKVIFSNENKIAVIAGPGSGKTEVLSQTVARRLFNGDLEPEKTIVVTFTNTAAKELKSRLAKKLGSEFDVRRFYHIGTLHALALNQLLMKGKLVGLDTEKLTVMTQDQSDELLESCIAETKITISAKGAKEGLAEFIRAGYKSKHVTKSLPFKMFVKKMRQSSCLSYDAMLVEFLKVLTYCSNAFSEFSLFVDEFQDSGTCDQSVYELMGCKSVMMIGDINQSIYSFRGARPELAMRSIRENGFRIYNLLANRRSTPNICSFANKVIMQNESFSGNCMISERMPYDPDIPDVGIALNMPGNVQRESVIRFLEEFTSTGSTAAILCRYNFQVEYWRSTLGNSEIKLQPESKRSISKGMRFLSDIMSSIVNDGNHLALRRVSDYMHGKEAGRRRFEAATNLRKDTGMSPLEIVSGQRLDLKDYAGVLNCIGSIAGKAAVDFMQEVSVNLKEGSSLTELSQAVTQTLNEPEIKEDNGGVTVCTIHASKGLEWDVVSVPDMHDKCFPKPSSKNIEEERRVFFVAITRARYKLLVTSPDVYKANYKYAKFEKVKASQFLK